MATRRQKSSPRKLPRRAPLIIPLIIIGIIIFCAALIVKAAKVDPFEVPRQVYVGEFDTIEIPVPVEPIQPGTKLKTVSFRNVAFPKHQVPEGAITDLSKYIEAVSTQPLPASLPIFKENLSFSTLGNNPVVERIPPGMRAMTIRVDATSAVEGWATSGSIVDVLLVQNNRTAVVAEKVRVLSLERSTSPLDGNTSPTNPNTATLLVTQEQCLAINTAIPLGKIAFALRSTNDDEGWNQGAYTADNLRGDSKGKRQVSGYVSIKGEDSHHTFALTDGKWIRTEIKPEGFLAAEN